MSILNDFVEDTIDNRGRNPKYYDNEKYPVIDNVLIKNFIYPDINAVTRYIDEDTYQKFLRGYVHKNMPIMTLVGSGIGNVSLAPNDKVAIVQNTIGFLVNNNADEIFLYYYLLNNQERIRNYNRGSGQPSVRKTDILGMEVSFPNIDAQKRIAKILFTIDTKIQNNNEINDNLAEQIRTLCNAWLTDYEPFGGTCPNDWELTPLSSFAQFISGYSYKGAELQNSQVAMATIKNFDRKGGFKLDGYKEIVPSGKLKPEHHANLFDTLVAHTDLTQNAEVIGNAEPVLSFSGYQDIIFSMDVVKVLPSNPLVSKFLIAALVQTQQFKSHCLGYVNGTTVLHLSKKALPDYSLMMPKDFSVLKPLDDIVSVMYQKMASNIDENVHLTELRDTILPRLMSGELDVSNLDI